MISVKKYLFMGLVHYVLIEIKWVTLTQKKKKRLTEKPAIFLRKDFVAEVPIKWGLRANLHYINFCEIWHTLCMPFLKCCTVPVLCNVLLIANINDDILINE